jgi:hypothetical protein
MGGTKGMMATTAAKTAHWAGTLRGGTAHMLRRWMKRWLYGELLEKLRGT